MNFQKLPPVETSKQYLDIAFRRAREKGTSEDFKGNWLQIIRKKECLKLDVVRDSLVKRLDKVINKYPDLDALSEFYIKLIKLTLEYGEFKKSFGALIWAKKKIYFFHRKYIGLINRSKDRLQIKGLTREYYGRISSVMKQIDENLKYLEECRRMMKTYPDVKDMFTVCIYGFPNVGKTTLLNELTGTKAKVAGYSFTTKTINAGYFENVQVLDVPGTLARKDKMNNIELQADLVLNNLADVVVYVFDISDSSGYSVDKQEELFKRLKGKKVLVYLSKRDLLGEFKFKHKFYSLKELKEKILSLVD